MLQGYFFNPASQFSTTLKSSGWFCWTGIANRNRLPSGVTSARLPGVADLILADRRSALSGSRTIRPELDQYFR